MSKDFLEVVRSMKKSAFPLIILFSLSLFTNGCCVYSPWRSEMYIHKATECIDLEGANDLPDEEKYSEYFVNHSFVSVGVRAHNESVYSGNSPYHIAIGVFGKKNFHTYAISSVRLIFE